MSRWVLALVAFGFVLAPAGAAEPKPVWEIDLGPAPKPKIKPHASWLAFSKESALVAVVTDDTGEFVQTFKLRAWDTKTRKERFTVDLGNRWTEARAMPHAALVGEDRVLTVGWKAGATVRDLTEGKELARSGTGAEKLWVWLTPDAKAYFTLRPVFGDTPFDEKTTVLRLPMPVKDPKDAQPLLTAEAKFPFPREGLEPRVVAFNPACDRFVIGYYDGLSRVGDPRHTLAVYSVGEKLKFDAVATIVPPHAGPVSSIAFSRDGGTMATGGEDGTICLWDTTKADDKWKPLATVRGPDFTVYTLAFRPDGKTLAVGTLDRKKPSLLLIDVASGKVVREMAIGSQMALAFSPDGKHLATSAAFESSIRVWDAEELLKAK